jgi:hypothetical protein
MDGYSTALFLHIVGALGIFAALGLEWTGLRQIRAAAAPEPVRAWLLILKGASRVGLVSMLAVIVSGIYMMATAWGPAAWIIVTIAALVLVIALALALSGPRLAAIGRALAAQPGRLPPTFIGLANNPLLWVSIQTRVAIVLGIVFLKVAKPDLGGSLLAIGAALVLGLLSALPMFRFEPAPAGSAD